MSKKSIFFVIIFIIAFGVGLYLYNSNNQKNNYTDLSKQNSTYNATQTIQNITIDNSTNNTTSEIESKPEPEPQAKPLTETEISTFTTKIYTKDSERQNNLSIACSTLNDTTIENGATFSFCNTVGKATSSKGYQKADVFQNGEVVEALGGGMCQVSSTLYNAVLSIPELKVTERHEHSNSVPYVKSGKDAAVAYGSYDFKFVNNTGNSIKIKAENTADNVTIKLLKLE